MSRPVPERRLATATTTPLAAGELDALLRTMRCVAWRVELPSWRVLYVSENVESVLGYARERWEEPGFHESIVHPDDRETAAAAVAAVIAGGPGCLLNYRMLRPDGRVLWVQDTLHVVRDAGGAAVALEGLLLDATERERELRALGLERERMRLTMEVAGVSAWEWDGERDRLAAYPLGRSLVPEVQWQDQPAETFISLVHPEDRALVRESAARTLETGERYSIRFRLIRPDGAVRHIASYGRAYGEAGRRTAVIGASRDVTDETAALREADEWRERFAIAARASGMTLVDHDLATDRCVWHSGDGTVFGHDPARIARFVDYAELLLPDDRDRLEARRAAHRLRPMGPHVDVYRLRHADGSVRAVEARGELVWSDGRPQRWIGHLIDVTARHELERQLRMQSSVLEALGEGVTVARVDGTLLLVNAALERMVGWSRRELIGRPLQMLTVRDDADYRRRSAEMAAHVHAHGSWTGEIVTRRRDGARLRVLATVTSAVIGQERIWITVRKDVTELRRLEAEVLRVSQHEKDQLAHELHEGLGQQLSGISFLASSLRAESTRTAAAVAPQAERLAQLVAEAVGSARRMAHGVSGFVLRHGGLEAALEELGVECERRDGVECRVSVDRELSRRLSEVRAYQLFRIAQEAATSALREAGARRLAIRLDEDAGRVRLCLADDGGPAAESERLAQVRRLIGYRAGLLGAELAIRAAEPRGHEIEVTFPLAALAEPGAGDER